MLTTLQQTLTRQLDIIPLDKLSLPITIVGAGAIGSWTALTLAKMGFFDITVWDHDSVAIENVNCQLYGVHDIGKPKVQALKELVDRMSAVSITPKHALYKPTIGSKGIIIMAVDSMKTREEIFEASVRVMDHVTLAIDSRMGAEKGLIYTINLLSSDQIKNYRKTLYSDENSEQVACTAKSTGYCATMLSGMVASQVKAYVTAKPLLKNYACDIPTGSVISFLHS